MPDAGGAVHPGRLVVVLVDRGQGAGEHQDLKGHDHPDGIKAQDEHLGPVGTVDKVNGFSAEKPDHQIDQSVGVLRLLEKDHKHQPYRQSVGHIGQEVYGLVTAPAEA